jgi:GTP cyclohydrolase II
MAKIAEHGGVVVYLFQEGRGIGLLGKMQAIRKQIDKGIDTAKAFEDLGHKPDIRSYACAAEALESLGLKGSIRLATNNPAKIAAMEAFGFKVQSRISLDIDPTEKIVSYRAMKRDALGHLE